MTGTDERSVGERDLFGIGFSDNLIHHGHCYVQATLDGGLKLHKHIGERFADAGQPLEQLPDRTWLLPIEGDGFKATFGIELSFVPEEGQGPSSEWWREYAAGVHAYSHTRRDRWTSGAGRSCSPARPAVLAP